MMVRLTAALLLVASPALAAPGKPFFSLANTDLIVLMAFVIFLGILIYFKVPAKITGLLDARGETIATELADARRLREEALELHASFERKQAEVQEQAQRIVAKAKEDAELVAAQAKADIESSIARRLKAAQDQIASAEASAIQEVRERATSVAIAAAGDVLAKKLDASQSDELIKKAIATAQERLH